MSTTSAMTASLAQDCIPSDETDILTHTCVLILTRVNGTLLDATSIQEEDIMEIYA